MKHQAALPKINATAIAVRSCFENNEAPEHSVSSKLEVQSTQAKELAPIPHAAAQFNDLPGCAFVRQPTVLALFACSKASLWRWVKSGRLPAPKRLGLRVSAWNVGQLRACLENLQTSGQADSTEGGK